jgi:imidazolonepropionase
MTDNSVQIWRNARLAARADPADVLENAAIVVRDGRIEWFGKEAEIPSTFAEAA